MSTSTDLFDEVEVRHADSYETSDFVVGREVVLQHYSVL